MGAQSSKDDTPAIDACLVDFPEHEQTHLLDLFSRLVQSSADLAKQRAAGNEDNHRLEQGHIDPEAFDRHFEPLLPPSLVACFRTTMQLHSAIHNTTHATGTMDPTSSTKDSNINKAAQHRRRSLARSASIDNRSGISKYGWVVTIHRLSKTLIEEQAGLNFMLQTHEASFETFVHNVTRAVMVYWTRFEIASWKDVSIDQVRGTTEYLLTLPFQKALRQAEMESMGDEDEDFQAKRRQIQREQDDWLASTTKRTPATAGAPSSSSSPPSSSPPSTKELSRAAFLRWYEKTVEYQVLFTILIQNLFLRPPIVNQHSHHAASRSPPSPSLVSQEFENKLCRKNFVAPRIQGFKPPPHYSRLMSIADYFQLRYAIPAPGAPPASSSFGTGSTAATSPTHATSTNPKKQSSDPLRSSGGNKGSTVTGSTGADGIDTTGDPESAPCPPFRLLFSSKTSGASFSTLLQKIQYQGPTIMVFKDEDGYIFGAYADADWEQGPKFYGTDRSFLFTIVPQFRIYRPTHVNQNYQYLDSGTKTLPNGIGFGGQLRYFGLWLASDFSNGHSAAEPICSTYGSPRLSKQQHFKLDELEVWQVQPSILEPPEGPKHSAMDTHADAVAMLELANRKMYSKDVRAPENVYADDDI